MSSTLAPSAAPSPAQPLGQALRVAFLGPCVWLDVSAPPAPTSHLVPRLVKLDVTVAPEDALAAAGELAPHATVVFDPSSLPPEAVEQLPGRTLGVLAAGTPQAAAGQALGGFDRLVSFFPALTGERVAGTRVWRAVPPPVCDALFAEVHPLHACPRAIAVGRSTEHRERMLMPAKHHHDLLQVLHGVSGPELGALLSECDVGVYVAPEPGGGFGQQVGMHLAAGQLLLAETLSPAHGLERNIDYLHFDSPEGLVWALERLGRFPEMHHRIRVRGRLKAEQYRASRLFTRIVHDLLADVSAFG